MNKVHIYFIQILFVIGIAIGSQVLNLEDKLKWLNVARYVIYFLTILGVQETCKLIHRLVANQPPGIGCDSPKAGPYVLILLSSLAALVLSEQPVFTHDFVFVFVGYLLVKYPEMSDSAERPAAGGAERRKPSIAYGVGMACSFLEGYLFHVIPSDGAKFVGFEENITALEDQEGVLFPVKKMFIVITKSLYSPPDLKEFNRGSDLPRIESFNIADIDVEEVKNDFCSTLQSILNKSPECRGKCELVYYDHEDPTQNLSEILLKRIAELAPNFEQQILHRRAQNKRDE